jgi:hypothetical protein
MTAPAQTAGDDQMMPDDSPTVLEEPTPDPPGAPVAGDLQPPPSVVWGHPGAVTADGAAEEPGVSGLADAEILSLVLAPGAEPDPAGTAAPDQGPAGASPAASTSTSPSAPWHEIQAMFVDDPRSAVEQAAGLAGERADALVMSVQERQQALMSAWHGDQAGTEELRTALQDYRTFWNYLANFPREP